MKTLLLIVMSTLMLLLASLALSATKRTTDALDAARQWQEINATNMRTIRRYECLSRWQNTALLACAHSTKQPEGPHCMELP